VIEAFIALERTVLKEARRLGFDSGRRANLFRQAARFLESRKALPTGMATRLYELSDIRNAAAHAADFEVEPGVVEDYVYTAMRIVTYLEGYDLYRDHEGRVLVADRVF
jgi:hypothetical protein